MDLGEWLRSLGLERYEGAFRDNAIDETVLSDLTDQDLEKLGVLLGHRRKLLRAIAELNGGSKDTARPSTEAAAAIAPQETAERRQVTVMFSDLVGSTALSARMDPEDLREVIAAYQKCIAKTVVRFGGYVAKYMGDGVLVYFGFPLAHEDDAERAVRAALELVTAVSDLKTHAALQTRVGIATGLVVVGDLIGSGAAQEQAVVGETPNLAARLQGIAEPNTVVIAESTRRLLGNLFELEDLGAKDLKGIAGPVRAWAALRPSAAESRFEALHAGGLTELVGREEELELLLRRWAKAKTGQGQVVLLSGEPGIGKSRLTAALMERLAGEPHTRLRYFCSPQHTDSALYPIIGQMERAAGFAHDDAVQAKLDKLDAVLAQSFTPRQDAALLAEMLSLRDDGRYPVLDLTPQQRRQKTMDALTAQIEALARSNPVLMIFEDAHWADPTSLEEFGRAVDRIRTLGVLLIVTYRLDFDAPWIGRPHVTALTLNRLGEREIGTVIDRVTGNKPLAAGIRQDIIQRTDGIPLFAEEMTKAVLEAETEDDAQRAAAPVPFPPLAVPPSLHASLMARLDRLGPAKEVAQVGAAIGREFSHALLASVVGNPEPQLQSALDRLIAAGLLFQQGAVPHASYLFKHALVQDAAYGTLLREPRRALHARIVKALESKFPEIADKQPEVLARHCAEAGQVEQAVHLWGKAGQRSLERSALVEAIEQFNRALDLIATLPSTPALRREAIKLQVALITPLLSVKGFGAPDTKVAAERARLLIEQAEALGEPPEDPLLSCAVLYGLCTSNYMAFNGDELRNRAKQLFKLAQKQGASAALLTAHRMMGLALACTGDVLQSRSHFDQAVALYEPTEHRALATRFGADARVSVLSFRSMALWTLGYPEAALADAANALKDAREIGQAVSLMYALLHTSPVQIYCGNYQAATTHLDEVVKLADERGATFWTAHGMMHESCALALAGKAADAVQLATAGLALYQTTRSTAWMPWYLSNLARAYADLGQLDGARRCLTEAMTAIATTKESWWEAEVHNAAGEIALKGKDAAKAETHFKHALSIAQEKQTKSFELRAAMSLARLWRDQGKPQQARELLVPVYGWFTQGFDTPDLKEAKALLGELAHTDP
jgi:predicted ATPase/class 3 adenylate cyclase